MILKTARSRSQVSKLVSDDSEISVLASLELRLQQDRAKHLLFSDVLSIRRDVRGDWGTRDETRD